MAQGKLLIVTLLAILGGLFLLSYTLEKPQELTNSLNQYNVTIFEWMKCIGIFNNY